MHCLCIGNISWQGMTHACRAFIEKLQLFCSWSKDVVWTLSYCFHLFQLVNFVIFHVPHFLLVLCGHNSSYSFILLFLKLCRRLLDGVIWTLSSD